MKNFALCFIAFSLSILAVLLGGLQYATAQVAFDHAYGFQGAPSDGSTPGYGSTLTASNNILFGVTLNGGQSNSGTLFMINSNLTGIHIIHNFLGKNVLNENGSLTDGARPAGTPLLLDGILYGTTIEGGSNALGTVYSIHTDGSNLQILHHFGGVFDAYEPYGSLIASGSTLYGMTTAGTNGITIGTIFAINTDGSNYRILYTFGPGGNPEGSLVLSGSTLFGMSNDGGSNNLGNIFMINTDGTGFKDLHSFTGQVNDGALPTGSPLLSGSTLYGATSTGGSNNVGVVFSINTDGTGFTILHHFAINNTWDPVSDLAISGSTLLGVTESGGYVANLGYGYGEGVVYRINTDGSGFQFVHTFDFPATESDGAKPLGPPTFIGNEVYGMTSLGGSTTDVGGIYALNPSGPGGGYTDKTPPSVTITYPTNNQHIFNQFSQLAGTATDNVAVYYVRIKWNNNPWLNTFSANGDTNWDYPLMVLTPGTNTASAYAVDTSGNHSKTNTVTFQYVVSSVLTVITNGAGSITTSLNGQTLQEGLIFSMTAKADKGSVFVNWTDGHGNVVTNGATVKFTMTANLFLIANFQDITPPAFTITAPKTGTKTSNDVATVTGTATDNVAVSNVVYSLNGGAPTKASLSSTAWSAQLALVPGTNTFAAYAVDTSGNHSTTNSIKLIYILSAQLTVNMVGEGTLKPDYTNAFLAISNQYTMVAKPDKGFSFYFWNMGGSMIDGTTLNFTMVTNLVITANFKDTNPPTLTITAPKAGEKFSNTVIAVTGTASDNVGVTAVGVQLNGAGWVAANGTTSWSTNLEPVIAGTNVVQAYAMDAAGNISKTNTVSFLGELPPDWAPNSLVDSSVLVTPASGNYITASFGLVSYSQTDTNTIGDSGTGAYLYEKTATNMADLALTLDSPLNLSSGTPQDIQLSFTSLNAGTFTNLSFMDYGTFSVVSATNFIPTSWTGHTFTTTNAAGDTITTVSISSATQLSVSESGGTIPAPYTVTNASPISAMFTITNALSGSLIFFQPTFTSKTGGYYEVNNFTNGVFENGDPGKFGFK